MKRNVQMMLPERLGSTLAFLLCVILSSCISFVSSYDQGIVDGITDYQKHALVMLANLERKGTSPEGAYQNFESEYDSLEAELDALLTRAAADTPSGISESAQREATQIINQAVDLNSEDYEGLSLTAQQIVSLRSLLRSWRLSHEQSNVLPAEMWSIRKQQLNQAVLAALTLEAAKREGQE